MEQFRIDRRFLSSKVARRILLLFVLSAIIPVSIIGVLGLLELRVELERRNWEWLRRESKAVGMTIAERLSYLSSELHFAVAGQSEWSGQTAEDLAGRKFGRIVLHALEDEYPVGESLSGRILTDAEREHLRTGEVLLVSVGKADRTEVYCLAAADPAALDKGVWVAEIRSSYVFGAAQQYVDRPGRALFVLDPEGRILFGTEVQREEHFTRLLQNMEAASGAFEWSPREGEDHRAAFWSIPLGFRYGSGDWRVVYSGPIEGMVDPLRNFTRDFILALAAALLLVGLVSTNLIQRSLNPLKKLREGTQALARGDLKSRVQLTSGDEFEQLAESFNLMACSLELQVEKLNSLHLGTLTAFARAVDAKSPWTAGHSERVTFWALRLGEEMQLTDAQMDRLRRGALLHDIGKLGVAARILDKPGRLSDEEYREVARHSEIGARILEPIEAFRDILQLVRHHHERLDGTGYPDGLSGADISLEVRILSAADAFDAIVSDRPYRQGKSVEETLSIMEECTGTQFDPDVIAALGRLYRKGSLTQIDLTFVRGGIDLRFEPVGGRPKGRLYAIS